MKVIKFHRSKKKQEGLYQKITVSSQVIVKGIALYELLKKSKILENLAF